MDRFQPPAFSPFPITMLNGQPPPIYAASCNPPRKAKKQKQDQHPTAPQASPPPEAAHVGTVTNQQNAKIRPAQPTLAPATEAASLIETPGPKRRGRKPGIVSRSARESQRKINHSLIEKARRSKINDALAALRGLVPPDYGRVRSDEKEGADTSQAKNRAKKEDKEREFKLEILERTVSYMKDLLERVKVYESGKCPSCGILQEGLKHTDAANCEPNNDKKRKYSGDNGSDREEDDLDLGELSDDEADTLDQNTGDDDAHQALSPPLSRSVSQSQLSTSSGSASSNKPHPRLPSISSWLSRPVHHSPTLLAGMPRSHRGSPHIPPQPYLPFLHSGPNGPNHLPTSIQGLPGPGMGGSHSSGQSQLLSPPTSGRSQPLVTARAPPSLSLPSPANPFVSQSPKRQENRRRDVTSSDLACILGPPLLEKSGWTANHGSRPSSGSQSGTNAPVSPNIRQSPRKTASGTPSPTWTQEDESVASVLIQMGTSSSSSPKEGSTSPTRNTSLQNSPGNVVSTHTPGSMLGIVSRNSN